MSLDLTKKHMLSFVLTANLCLLITACTPGQSQPKTRGADTHSQLEHAHDHASSDSTQEPKSVVPQSEREIAQTRQLKGPSQTHGISGVVLKAHLDLGKEWSAMRGQQLRARELTLDPGAVVAVHQHQKRPGFAYILEGEVVEHRDDQKAPIVRRVGDVAVEYTGVAHWWENRSKKTVRALVVDVVPIKP